MQCNQIEYRQRQEIVFKEVFDVKLDRGDEPSGVNRPLLEGTPEHSFRNVPKKVRLWSTRKCTTVKESGLILSIVEDMIDWFKASLLSQSSLEINRTPLDAAGGHGF
jgi:hypothetical protein